MIAVLPGMSETGKSAESMCVHQAGESVHLN